jgi:hypothetical protein
MLPRFKGRGRAIRYLVSLGLIDDGTIVRL